MDAWEFLVDKSDLSRTEVRPTPALDATALAEGDVLLEIERFSLTANNITYAVFGDRMGYWRFFPAADGWGRVPVWGFARVSASRADGVADGTRLYGYWPMSTHAVLRLRPAGTGFIDAADHRADLPLAYNRYDLAPDTPHDDHLALLRPLFTTSFLLDDQLAEIAPDATAILSSASSRTAIGLAWMLTRRGAPVLALTSARNAAFVRSLGLYDRVLGYGEVDASAIDGAAVFVDMAGDAAVRADIHRSFGDRLVHSAAVGGTHHDAPQASADALPGPEPTFFFAPDRLVRRRQDWGAKALNERIGQALERFIDESSWLEIRRHHGPDALSAVYARILDGAASPAQGNIVTPR